VDDVERDLTDLRLDVQFAAKNLGDFYDTVASCLFRMDLASERDKLTYLSKVLNEQQKADAAEERFRGACLEVRTAGGDPEAWTEYHWLKTRILRSGMRTVCDVANRTLRCRSDGTVSADVARQSRARKR
jgi:hypothetical protein